MSAPTAIRATFSEWKMVKTRKVLQLIFEFPLEQQADVLTILGAPMPDAEIWCGIARLVPIDKFPVLEQSQNALPTPATEPRGSDGPTEPVDAEGRTAGSIPATGAKSERAKAAYAQATPGEQAVTRAALLANDERFQEWVGHIPGRAATVAVDPEFAAHYIRAHCCDNGSRKLIAEDADCLARFLALEVDYKIWSGQIAEPR